MTGATHGGKGSGRRPESEPGAYASGWDAIFGKGRKAEPEEPAESPEYKCAGCGKAIGDYLPDDWDGCRRCGCVTAERARRRG